MQQQQQQQTQGFSPKDFMQSAQDWSFVVVEAFAITVALFLRKRFGQRYIGAFALLPILFVPLFGLLFQGADRAGLQYFLLLYLLMGFFARMGVGWRRWRGTTGEHSFYTGRPRIMRWFGRCSEVNIKRFVEPLIVLSVGLIFCGIDLPLGAYLMVAAVALFLSTHWAVVREFREAIEMNDSVIDAGRRAERFRSMNRRR